MQAQSEATLRLIFESVTDGITVSGLEGNIRQLNQAVVRMHRYPSKQALIGSNALALVAPQDHSRARDNFEQVLSDGYSRELEYTFLTRDGREFPAELSGAAIRDDGGNPIGFVAITRDITQRKRAEEREQQLQRELNMSSRLASIGELASGVAHEINNPLTSVIGFSQILMNRDIPQDIKKDVKIISDSAQRVAKIIKSLLAFARQHGEGKEPVDINDLVLSVLELRHYEMKLSNIELSTQLAAELPGTMANAGQLQQVFLNIVLNAEQAITSISNRGQLTVKTERQDDVIRVTFEDDGPGITRENLEKVFDPFFTTKDVAEGTGLGLSVSYGIIKEHNGRIQAVSGPGKGATFVVELPVVTELDLVEVSGPTDDGIREAARARILVIDDEPAICQFLERMLHNDGHIADTVNNASDALEKMERERYRLILLDIRMAGMNGIELYQRMGKIARSLQRRVVFITGDTMTGATRKFLDRTKAHYITKPFDVIQLKEDIDRILSGAG